MGCRVRVMGHQSHDNPIEAAAWTAECAFLGHLSHDNPTEAAAWATECVFWNIYPMTTLLRQLHGLQGACFWEIPTDNLDIFHAALLEKNKLNSIFFSPVTSYSTISAYPFSEMRIKCNKKYLKVHGKSIFVAVHKGLSS